MLFFTDLHVNYNLKNLKLQSTVFMLPDGAKNAFCKKKLRCICQIPENCTSKFACSVKALVNLI